VGWLRAATIENQPYVVPLEDQVAYARDFEDQSSDDIAADIWLCVERLRELGHEVLIRDHTRPDIGFPTARVIVPGLRHFWARFAPGRLYDVPVSLGWLERAHHEGDLNPIPVWW
jgi:ribosomal protein S12 methylthiotransferase accessory factor YcaO